MKAPYVGQSVTAVAESLTNPVGEALVSPTVTFTFVAPNLTETVVAGVLVGSQYRASFVPAMEGLHTVKVSASAGNGVWRDTTTFHAWVF